MQFAQAKRLFFVGFVASLCATAALAILFLLFGEFDDTAGRILLTTALIALFSLFALPAGVLLDKGRVAWLAWTTIGVSALALVLSLALVWASWEEDPGEAHWKAVAVTGAFAAAFSQAAATTSRRRDDDTPAVRVLYVVALGLGALLALLIAGAALAEVEDENYYRGLAAVAVADLLFVILQAVVRRLAALGPAATSGHHRVVFTLADAPSAKAVEAARQALEAGGVRVERVERRP